MRLESVMTLMLEQQISDLFNNPPEHGYTSEHFSIFERFKLALNTGEVRAASPVGGSWKVNLWVKQGILLGFRMGTLIDYSIDGRFRFFDKHTFPLRQITVEDGVRVVPGGSAIRDGVYLGRGVTCMPPMYINVGSYVDDGTMVDSHALVGSCAQIGKRVHLSAASQIGGVLEPVGALPVIVEDDVLVGGNCGIYEGTLVREGAVIGAGTVLTGGTPVYDLIRKAVYRRTGDRPLEIPPSAVVVPGSRALQDEWGREQGLSIYTPIIIKYRDSKTERSIQLEDILR
ncbi:MAG: 2,3,4,5-tetrahydropyridine-2,6-dicarboxylate N-succinyltransferase [Bacteroidetes bacterium]|nr:2,3,4,5-tetrahydropyridine-2,6-dicarboxylate N-succinyltransferase [Bacteroidota bacterium]